jgi:hypothetical protein
MKIKLTKEANTRTKRRVNRHGYEYDVILEHFINDKPAPFGILVKSHKTGRYTWFDSKTVIFIVDDMYEMKDKIPVPELIEGIKTYTPNQQLLREYLDHLTKNVLSKRDQKKYGPIYDKIKA